MKGMVLGFLIVMIGLVFIGCYYPTVDPPVTAVAFSGLTPNGTSGTETTTVLTLTFDVDPTGLTAGDITVTGAAKGALIGTGTTRTLAISAVSVANGAYVTVAIANPPGFRITPASRDVAINTMLNLVRVTAGTFQRDATATNTSYVTAFRKFILTPLLSQIEK